MIKFPIMKETFRIIKKHFILLLGTGLFTCGLFNFNNGVHTGHGGLLMPRSGETYPVATYYYYTDTTLFWLTIGAILIVIGLLKMRKD